MGEKDRSSAVSEQGGLGGVQAQPWVGHVQAEVHGKTAHQIKERVQKPQHKNSFIWITEIMPGWLEGQGALGFTGQVKDLVFVVYIQWESIGRLKQRSDIWLECPKVPGGLDVDSGLYYTRICLFK